MKALLTPVARRDLRSIWRYIARDSVHHADLVEAAILATCELAAEMPEIGHRRPEFSESEYRFLVVSAYKRYSVVYLERAGVVEILGVIHGAREIRGLLLS